MQLQVQPLKWKKARLYGIEEVPVSDGPVSRTIASAIEATNYIVPRTKEEEYEVAVSAECATCLALANTVTSDRMTAERHAEWSLTACDFAGNWGLLSTPTGREPFTEFLVTARSMRRAIERVKDGGLSKLGIIDGLRVDLIHDTPGEPGLRVRSLLDLCWVEIIEAAQREDQFWVCATCSKMGVEPKLKKGRPRTYCSDACRKVAERARKSRSTT